MYLELKRDPEVQKFAGEFENEIEFSRAYAKAYANTISPGTNVNDYEAMKQGVLKSFKDILAEYAKTEPKKKSGKILRAVAWVVSKLPLDSIIKVFVKK